MFWFVIKTNAVLLFLGEHVQVQRNCGLVAFQRSRAVVKCTQVEFFVCILTSGRCSPLGDLI